MRHLAAMLPVTLGARPVLHGVVKAGTGVDPSPDLGVARDALGVVVARALDVTVAARRHAVQRGVRQASHFARGELAIDARPQP